MRKISYKIAATCKLFKCITELICFLTSEIQCNSILSYKKIAILLKNVQILTQKPHTRCQILHILMQKRSIFTTAFEVRVYYW